MSPTLHSKAWTWSLHHLPSIPFPNDSPMNMQNWRTHCKLDSGLGFIYYLTQTLNSNREVVMTLRVFRYYPQLWTRSNDPESVCVLPFAWRIVVKKMACIPSWGLGVWLVDLPWCFKIFRPGITASSSIIGSWVQIWLRSGDCTKGCCSQFPTHPSLISSDESSSSLTGYLSILPPGMWYSIKPLHNSEGQASLAATPTLPVMMIIVSTGSWSWCTATWPLLLQSPAIPVVRVSLTPGQHHPPQVLAHTGQHCWEPLWCWWLSSSTFLLALVRVTFPSSRWFGHPESIHLSGLSPLPFNPSLHSLP